MARRVAYVMSRFPHLPETFILREMEELARLGYEVVPCPLVRQRQPIVHRAAAPWMDRIVYRPFLSLEGLAANLGTLARQPALYAAVWGRVIWGSRSRPDVLLRAIAMLPKAIHAAHRVRQDGIRHVHAHYATYPALFAWIIHRFTGVPYSLTVHAHDIFVQRTMLDAKLRAASFVVAISDFNRGFLSRSLGPWVDGKVEVIHCGVEPDKYRRRRAPSKEGPLEILTIGSLQPYKGIEHLLAACHRLHRQGFPLRCRVIGEGRERGRLERLVREWGLEDRVELLGGLPQEAVAERLPETDCYVQPSVVTPSGKMEGIPVALMEALACEVPVIASSISGIPELVRPGETGQLVPPGDAEALARAIVWVRANPDRAAAQARAGRELVVQEFQLSTNVRRLARLLDLSLGEGPDQPPAHGFRRRAASAERAPAAAGS